MTNFEKVGLFMTTLWKLKKNQVSVVIKLTI